MYAQLSNSIITTKQKKKHLIYSAISFQKIIKESKIDDRLLTTDTVTFSSTNIYIPHEPKKLLSMCIIFTYIFKVSIPSNEVKQGQFKKKFG